MGQANAIGSSINTGLGIAGMGAGANGMLGSGVQNMLGAGSASSGAGSGAPSWLNPSSFLMNSGGFGGAASSAASSLPLFMA